jgi:hypothetical protein
MRIAEGPSKASRTVTAGELQELGEARREVPVVLDDQHPTAVGTAGRCPRRGASPSSAPASGIASRNSDPRSGPALVADNVPPWRRVNRSAIARPSPRPPACPVAALLALRERLEHRRGELPVEADTGVPDGDDADPSRSVQEISIAPPDGVNLIAFASRLSRICRRRTRSPLTLHAGSSNCVAPERPASSSRCCCSSRTSVTSVSRSTRSE